MKIVGQHADVLKKMSLGLRSNTLINNIANKPWAKSATVFPLTAVRGPAVADVRPRIFCSL